MKHARSANNAKQRGSSAFQACYNFMELHLDSVSSVTTPNALAFSSTPIGGYSASAGRTALHRAVVEARFARYFADHKALWDEVPEAERMAMSNGIRSRSVMEGMPMETITIGAWLDHVGNLG